MVKGVFHRHQLHFQLVLGDLFLADAEGILFQAEIVLHDFFVRVGGDAHQLLEGLDDLVVLHGGVGHGDLAVFQTPGRLHDDGLVLLDLDALGVKIINLADFFESDADHFCHKTSHRAPQKAASAPASAVTEGFWSSIARCVSKYSHVSMNRLSPCLAAASAKRRQLSSQKVP